MSTHYDIVICGGGFVGHALLLACQKVGLSVCLVDAKAPEFDASSDGRAIALSYASITFLKNLQVWDKLSAVATSIDRVQVSAQGRLGTMVFEGKDLDISYLGQVIPAPVLGSALSVASASGGCLLLDTITAIHSNENFATITLKNNILTASLVLACDGTQSFCRDYLHMHAEQKASHKKAVVTNIQLDASHHHTAYQRLIPQGVCALLPLRNHKMTAVLSLDDLQADKMQNLSDEVLSQTLKNMWGNRFGNMHVEGKRFCYPLSQVYVKNPVKDRVILIGNAAHTILPIAAQGLNLAFRDIAVLYDILEDARALSKDLGIYVPDIYLKRIQPAHEKMHRMTDVMANAIYSPSLSPFQGIGLSLLHHLPFMKNKWATLFAGLDAHRGELMAD